VDGAVFEEGSSHTLPISREGTEDVQVAGASGKGRAQSSMPDGYRFCCCVSFSWPPGTFHGNVRALVRWSARHKAQQ